MKTIKEALKEGCIAVMRRSLSEALALSTDLEKIFKDLLKRDEAEKLLSSSPFSTVKADDKDPMNLVDVVTNQGKKMKLKFGKFIGELYKAAFPELSEKELQKKQRDFTDALKKTFGATATQYKFVEYSKVTTVYKSANYAPYVGSDATELQKSCMKDDIAYLKMYDDHPDIKALALLDSDGKIVARCLLWEDLLLNGKKKISYADRVYYHTKDQLGVMLAHIAKKGYYNREKQEISNKDKFEKGGSKVNGSSSLFYIDLDKYSSHPYLDTMTYPYYDMELKKYCLSNDPNLK